MQVAYNGAPMNARYSQMFSLSPFHAGRVWAVLSCLVGISLLIGCGTRPENRSTPPSVPRYPNIAQEYETQVRRYVNGADEERLIAFDTTDSPEAVMRFYRDNLPEWRPLRIRQAGQASEAPGEYTTNTCPFYSLEIKVQSRSATSNSVELFLRTTLCK